MSAPMPSDLGARVPAATGNEEAGATPAPAPTCPVCMEPWTCNGDHRICCIPCGHVYGRSCLERWLRRCGDGSAKCPQCGEQFEDELIINLYAPGNLWDGCCRIQELKAQYESRMTEYMAKAQSDIEELRTDLIGHYTELKEQNSRETAELRDKTRVAVESLHGGALQIVGEIARMWNKQNAAANANLATMKERMKKMAEEENATAAKLIEFVQRNSPQLPLFSNPQAFVSAFASALAPAPVDSQNNTGRHRSRADQLPPAPVPASSCPADAAKKRRREGPDV